MSYTKRENGGVSVALPGFTAILEPNMDAKIQVVDSAGLAHSIIVKDGLVEDTQQKRFAEPKQEQK